MKAHHGSFASSLVAVAAALVFSFGGCATPKEINGQKVLKAKWVNGQLVYVLEGNKELMATGAAEAKEASKGVIFAPLK